MWLVHMVHTMAIKINVAEAKSKLSALIEAALNGEEVVIARAGKAAVRLTPVNPRPVRRLGILKEYGWTHETPYAVFEPEPEHTDWIDKPLASDE